MDHTTYLCKEAVIEILARLPAKSLVRFMAVCRLWKSIISSPQFRLVSKRPTKLLVHTNQECYTLVEDKEENVLMFETDFPLKNYGYNTATAVPLGSDDGLVCIGMRIADRCQYSCVVIWNPCIRKLMVIPNYPMEDHETVYAHGFGATVSGSDHKYVRLVGFSVPYMRYCHRKAFEVYSLKTGTWQRHYLDLYLYRRREFSLTCALLRGRLHFIIFDRSTVYNLNFISSFELEDEVFEDIIMLPEYLSNLPDTIILDVFVIKESLAVIAKENERRSSVWVMQEYGDVNSWSKFCNIDLAMASFDRVPRYVVRLLNNGELLLGLLTVGVMHTEITLVTYNLKTRGTTEFGGVSSSKLSGFTNSYKESLVLLADDYHAESDHKVLSMFERHCNFVY